MGAAKGKGKPNGNIMSFFKKAETPGATAIDSKEEDDGLFLGDSPVKGGANMPLQTPTPPREESSIEIWPEDVEMESADSQFARYNETVMPSKRRRTDGTPTQSPPIESTKPGLIRGPFIDESDSDDEQVKSPSLCTLQTIGHEKDCERTIRDTTPVKERQLLGKTPVCIEMPSLKQETTSMGENDFDGVEDFIDDEFPEEGEEYLERRWMEEQAEFEEGLEEEGQAMEDRTMDVESGAPRDAVGIMPQDAGSSSCPICGGNTAGLNDQVCEHPNVLASLTRQRRYPFMSMTV